MEKKSNIVLVAAALFCGALAFVSCCGNGSDNADITSASVAVKDGEVLGMLLETYDDCYLVDIQDSVLIPKDGVEIQLWSASNGQGVVFPKNPGKYQVYTQPAPKASVIGTVTYESGYVPDTYKCLGWEDTGWFKIEISGTEGYVKASEFAWDFVDRF